MKRYLFALLPAVLPPLLLPLLLPLLPLLFLVSGSASAAPPDPLIVLINAYRATPVGCDGRSAAPLPPLTAPAALARVRVETGTLLDLALQRAGYPAAQAEAIYLSGGADAQAAMRRIEQAYCRTLRSAQLSAIGVVRAPGSVLIILARPAPPSAASLLPPQAEAGRQVLAAVNRARSQARSCGNAYFAAAGPLVWDELLASAALAHSSEMAAQSYFNHRGADGGMAAERAAQAGYRADSIGENIAVGQDSAETVVQDWLTSPGHCANLMNAGFTGMGAAYAVNPAREPPRIYWTQVFGRPVQSPAPAFTAPADRSSENQSK